MEPGLTLTLKSGQIVTVTLSNFAEAKVLALIAAERIAMLAKQDLLTRTYHLGTQATNGLHYDDRLTTRIKCGHNMAYRYLMLPVEEGGLRHTRMGKKYIITEEAVRHFFGDSIV